MIRLLLFFSLVFLVQSCYKEKIIFDTDPNDQLELPLLLNLNNKDCFLDHHSHRLRYSIDKDSIKNFNPYIRFQPYSKIVFNGISLINNANNKLGNIHLNKNYSLQITTNGSTSSFTLTFTNLPIIRVVTPNRIINEPKKIASITVNYPDSNTPAMTSFIGIEYRGASSQFRAKKSYGFSFFSTMSLDHKISKSLFGWNNNIAWILDGMYVDKSRLRNKVSFELWHQINPSKNNYIKSKPVELYINNHYEGLYALNEQLNAEHIGLVDTESILYKTTDSSDDGTLFKRLGTPMPYFTNTWDGWEQKHPNPKERINWQPLYDLRNTAINKSDTEFITKINSHIDLDAFIDYYIFINTLSGHDNVGKNIIWTRQNSVTPFILTPWDIDASWGRYWDGNPILSHRIFSNYLFDKLLALSPNNFRVKLKNRWLYLRTNIITYSNISSLFEDSFLELSKSDIIAAENAQWSINLDLQQEHIFIDNWITGRLIFLDNYFAGL